MSNVVPLQPGGIREALEAEQQQMIVPDESKFDPIKALSSADIDLSIPLSPPESAIVIKNKDGQIAPICTLGNFSLVIGKAKSKKTFFVSLMLGASGSEWPVGQIQGMLPDSKRGRILFDTEQGMYHVQKTGRRVVEVANSAKGFNVFGLRKYSYKERVLIIEAALIKFPNVGFIVIDGLRDLIADINDPSESVSIIGKLMKWTEEYNVHIMCILHQNKADDNARGHLGTEAVNKAETVLSVNKDSKISSLAMVKTEFCRDREPDQIFFEIDEKGIPRVVDGAEYTSKDSKSIKAKDKAQDVKHPDKLDPLFHRELLTEMFSDPTTAQPRVGQLYTKARIILQRKGFSVAKNDYENLIKWYKEVKMIKLGGGTSGTISAWYTLNRDYPD